MVPVAVYGPTLRVAVVEITPRGETDNPLVIDVTVHVTGNVAP
jgi:hypothetical protein